MATSFPMFFLDDHRGDCEQELPFMRFRGGSSRSSTGRPKSLHIESAVRGKVEIAAKRTKSIMNQHAFHLLCLPPSVHPSVRETERATAAHRGRMKYRCCVSLPFLFRLNLCVRHSENGTESKESKTETNNIHFRCFRKPFFFSKTITHGSGFCNRKPGESHQCRS